MARLCTILILFLYIDGVFGEVEAWEGRGMVGALMDGNGSLSVIAVFKVP
jgi:hypothetical protein